MNKNDALRFKVTVSPTYSDLYEVMNQAGPYYRSRRLLQLALLGLAVEKGNLVAAIPKINIDQQPVSKTALINPLDHGHHSPTAETVDSENSPVTAKLQSSNNEIPSTPQPHYKISSNAAEAISEMLGSLDQDLSF